VQPGQPAQGVRVEAGYAPGSAGGSDQQIAALIYGVAHNEIEIAKFAESKLQNEEVRQFAQQMVSEHTPGCEAMQQLAGNLVAAHEGQAATAGTTREETRPAIRAPAPTGGALDWVSIHQQIGQQCLESTKKELSAKQGGEFDQCFLGQQIMAHMLAIDKLKVLSQYASPELREKLQKETQMATTHLEKAKQIAKQLMDRPSERVSRQPK
jgi:predicted outer membrane protein